MPVHEIRGADYAHLHAERPPQTRRSGLERRFEEEFREREDAGQGNEVAQHAHGRRQHGRLEIDGVDKERPVIM